MGLHECCDPTGGAGADMHAATPLGAWGRSVISLAITVWGRAAVGSHRSHIDLDPALYVLYGVKYIDLVSLSLGAWGRSVFCLVPRHARPGEAGPGRSNAGPNHAWRGSHYHIKILPDGAARDVELTPAAFAHQLQHTDARGLQRTDARGFIN